MTAGICVVLHLLGRVVSSSDQGHLRSKAIFSTRGNLQNCRFCTSIFSNFRGPHKAEKACLGGRSPSAASARKPTSLRAAAAAATSHANAPKRGCPWTCSPAAPIRGAHAIPTGARAYPRLRAQHGSSARVFTLFSSLQPSRQRRR